MNNAKWEQCVVAKISGNVDMESKELAISTRNAELFERELQYIFHLGIKDVLIP